jgi:cobalt-zinc-cadmium efflux system protein
MSHHHGHHHHGPHGRQHHHGEADGSDGRLVFSIVLNAAITIAEFVGGIISGSLALISDALHNLTDTTSLAVAYVARKISRRDATQAKTFGYRRAEIIAAFVNLVTLVLIALFLIKEAVERVFDPQPIDGGVMLVVAVIGLVANFVSAAILFRDARHSLNIRSAFLHILSDGVSSVAVVAGGIVIIAYDFHLIDPILTVAISLYLLVHSYHMLKQTVNILMESTPTDVDIPMLARDLVALPFVVDVHHIHVWQLDEVHRAFEAHVVIDRESIDEMEVTKTRIKEYLQRMHHIGHSTLEFEFEPCTEADGTPCYDVAIPTPGGPAS